MPLAGCLPALKALAAETRSVAHRAMLNAFKAAAAAAAAASHLYVTLAMTSLLCVCMQANTGAGSLAANSVGAAGGYGGGAVGGAIPARGRKLQQGGKDGPHGGKQNNNNWSPSPPGDSSGEPTAAPALPESAARDPT